LDRIDSTLFVAPLPLCWCSGSVSIRSLEAIYDCAKRVSARQCCERLVAPPDDPGSTGSIGDSTLSVVAHARATHGPDAFPLEALTASRASTTGGAGARISSSLAVIEIPRSTRS